MDLLAELHNVVAIACFVLATWAVLLLRDRKQARAVDDVVAEDPRVLLQRSRAFNLDEQITWLTAPAPGDNSRIR